MESDAGEATICLGTPQCLDAAAPLTDLVSILAMSQPKSASPLTQVQFQNGLIDPDDDTSEMPFCCNERSLGALVDKKFLLVSFCHFFFTVGQQQALAKGKSCLEFDHCFFGPTKIRGGCLFNETVEQCAWTFKHSFPDARWICKAAKEGKLDSCKIILAHGKVSSMKEMEMLRSITGRVVELKAVSYTHLTLPTNREV